MQEKRKPCFVVATANDTRALPPEFLRKGRFDEIFFLDLPTAQERREILAVHLKKRKRFADDFDLEMLAEISQGYVGAEIEQAVIDGMYFAFDENRELETGDILRALQKQVPLSRSQAETVSELRRMLLEGKAQSASFKETSEAKEAFVGLQLEFSQDRSQD